MLKETVAEKVFCVLLSKVMLLSVDIHQIPQRLLDIYICRHNYYIGKQTKIRNNNLQYGIVFIHDISCV